MMIVRGAKDEPTMNAMVTMSKTSSP